MLRDVSMPVYTDSGTEKQKLVFAYDVLSESIVFKILYNGITGAVSDMLEAYYLIRGEKIRVVDVGDKLHDMSPSGINYSRITAGKLYSVAFGLYRDEHMETGGGWDVVLFRDFEDRTGYLVADCLPEGWEGIEHFILARDESYEQALIEVILHQNRNCRPTDKAIGIEFMRQSAVLVYGELYEVFY